VQRLAKRLEAVLWHHISFFISCFLPLVVSLDFLGRHVVDISLTLDEMKQKHYSIVRMTNYLTAARRNSILPKPLVRMPQVEDPRYGLPLSGF
jgi:hypothetical protein